MKQISSFITTTLLLAATSLNAQMNLQMLWSSDTILKVPESVLYSKADKLLYISNIDGKPDEKDGKGSIGKVGLDGKVIQAEWVTGLNAPKGMAIVGSSLWVADIDRMVEIDIKAGKIKRTIAIEGAQFLNDVTAAPDGKIYVSDSKGKTIYKLSNLAPSLFLKSLKGPN